MHGLIVLGFNGAVVFHTSPLTRTVVDHIVEIVQSDLHMSVATQYYTSIVTSRGNDNNTTNGRELDTSSRSGGDHHHHSYSATSVASSLRTTMAPSSVTNRSGHTSAVVPSHLLVVPSAASNLSRSQTNAMYRASAALDRGSSAMAAGGGGGNDASSSSSGGQKKRRFKFMARTDASGNTSATAASPPPLGLSGGATSSSAGKNTNNNFFISDTAYATSHCMARNVKATCDGVIAISPSEHVWLRHHIASFVAIGEMRREEADEDLIAADSDAVARINVPSSSAAASIQGGGGGSGVDIFGRGGGATPQRFNQNGDCLDDTMNGVGGGGTTASQAAVFTRGVNVVPPQTSSNVFNAGNGNNGAAASNAATTAANDPQRNRSPIAATTTAGGGVVIDPTVSSTELFVMLYWRKIGDRVFILVLHEEDSIALAKHVLSTFVVLLTETFRLNVTEGAADGGGGAGVGSGAAGGSSASARSALAYQHMHGNLSGLNTAVSSNMNNASEASRLFAAVDRVMREDTALSQLPSLRAMLMRPDVVQKCLDVVAPQNVMAMVDLGMARTCITRQMKGTKSGK